MKLRIFPSLSRILTFMSSRAANFISPSHILLHQDGKFDFFTLKIRFRLRRNKGKVFQVKMFWGRNKIYMNRKENWRKWGVGLYKMFHDVKLRLNAVFVLRSFLFAILESMNNLRTSLEHETKCECFMWILHVVTSMLQIIVFDSTKWRNNSEMLEKREDFSLLIFTMVFQYFELKSSLFSIFK